MRDAVQRIASPDQHAVESPLWSGATRYIVGIFLVIAGIFVIVLLGPIIQTLVWAFLFAFAVSAPSRALARHTPISYRLAVVLIYLVLTVIIIALLVVVTPAIIDGVNELWTSLQASYQEFAGKLEAYQPGDVVVEILGFEIDLNPIIEPIRDFVLRGETEELATSVKEAAVETETPQELLEDIRLLGVIGGLINMVAWLVQRLGGLLFGSVGYIAILVMAAYVAFVYLLELPKTRGVIHKWIPAVYEREVGLMLFKIDDTWNGFFRGQLVVAVLLAVASYLQFLLTGLPGARVLALLVGFLSLVPWIGGPIATVIVTGVALLQGSTVFVDMPNWQFALLTLAINGVLTQTSSNVIQPVIYGGAVRISATSVVIGVSLGLALGGILGAFLVVPIMGTLRVLVYYLISKLAGRDPYPAEEPPDPSGEGFFSEVFYFRRGPLDSQTEETQAAT